MKTFLTICLLSIAATAQAQLKVVTSTPDLAAIAAEVGGDLITVDSIALGTQDPHFIEAKPSYMVKARNADLIVSIGLDLEAAWLPNIVRGARNPRIATGSAGYFEVGPRLDPLEVAASAVTRRDGDVHPLGNPHLTLDPIRVGQMAILLAEKLSVLDTTHSTRYAERAQAFKSKLEAQTKAWMARLEKSGVTRVVTYHRTLTYFLKRFGIENPAMLEPKPGIPPTSGHILGVIRTIREQKVPLILVENYFDPSITRKIIQELPNVHVETVAVSIGGKPEIRSFTDLYEDLVRSIERAKPTGASRP